MPPSLLANTYRRYKQDTDDIATWLATTANQFGFSTVTLKDNSKNPTQQKSQRLKGKARKQAKQISSDDTSPKDTSPDDTSPKYTISVKDFSAFAEFLAPKPNVQVPAPVWETLERAIRLRQGHKDYHAQQQAADNQTGDGHAYFLGVLEKVRDLLRPRRQIGLTPPQVQPAPSSNPANDAEIRLDNIFAALTVEEPSEAFLNIPDIAPATKSDKDTAVYMVEPRNDPLEILLAVGAMLFDCHSIRYAILKTWGVYAQRLTTPIPAAVTTDVGIRMIQELEEQFMKDHPYESSTVNARENFCFPPCKMSEGLDPLPDRFTNGGAEMGYLVTHWLIRSFKHLVKPGKQPRIKHGSLEVFDPGKDRANMTGNKKVYEDLKLVSEIFSDIMFFHHMNSGGQLKATDEFTKAVALLQNQGHHTMTLDFATQIYLDIHQLLKGQASVGADDLQTYVKACKETLEKHFEFQADLNVVNGSQEKLDEPLRMIPEVLDSWLVKDDFGKLQTNDLINAGTPLEQLPPPRAFFKAHPWLCGSLMFGMKLEMQHMGLALCKATGSAKFTAHIYNAARQENFLTKSWEDMDLAMMLHGDRAIFVGDKPKNADDYFRRYSLSLGYSAQNFCQGGKRKHSRPLESKRGPRGQMEQEDATPVAYELRSGYISPQSKAVSDIDKVLTKVLEIKMNYELAPEVVASHKRYGNRFIKPEFLLLIFHSLIHEDLALTFDYFHLHRQAWRLLRAINSNVTDDLTNIYGPGFIKSEKQLPLVVGFILMTAVNTKKFDTLLQPKKFDIITLNLLKKASKVLERTMDSGSGRLEIKILREKYRLVWMKK